MVRTNSPRGMSMVEVIVAMAVLMVALLGLVSAIISAQRTGQSTRELTLAMNAARQKIEEMRAQDFADVYTNYNSDSKDDPGGEGTGSGNAFAVEGLTGTDGGDAGGILFPEDNAGNLSESVTDADWGMPRDLNADGAVDTDDRTDDYKSLPIRIVITWKGMSTEQSFEMNSILYEKQ